MKQIAIAAASSLIVGAVLVAQTGQLRSNDGDWPMFSHDFGGTRFSPLTDITADNASRLAQAWSVQLTQPAGRRGGGAPPPAEGAQPQGRGAGGRGRAGGAAAAAAEEGDAAGSNPEATPIVVNGVMYLPVRGHQVLALDAETGEEIWRYQMPTTVTTTARGVAYWPGDGDIRARILLTAGPRLLALDAATGQPAAGFGRDGVDRDLVPWNGVPLIYSTSRSSAPTRASARSGRPAIRVRSTCAPARSCGSSTPCRCRVRSVTRPGSTTAGAIGRAPTSGPST